jgi:hypothetical protein
MLYSDFPEDLAVVLFGKVYARALWQAGTTLEIGDLPALPPPAVGYSPSRLTIKEIGR